MASMSCEVSGVGGMRMTASMDGEATGGNGGSTVDGWGGRDGNRDDAWWLATASGGDERPVVSGRGDGVGCASSNTSWRTADDVGDTGGGGVEAGPSAGGDLGEAGCDGGRAGPTGAVGVGEGGGSSDGGEAGGRVDRWGAHVSRSISSCAT